MKMIPFYTFSLFIFLGCSRPKIEITTEYIINPNWNEYSNHILINKLKVKKDSTINPYSELSQVELLTKMEDDSSFIWIAKATIKSGQSYGNTKIYFARDNNFTWRNAWQKDLANEHTQTIGRLEKLQWYKISGLYPYALLYYVYVDSSESVRRFTINLANY